MSISAASTHCITHLLVGDDLLQLCLQLLWQQHGLQAPGGDPSPVKVFHAQGPTQLQVGAMEQVSLGELGCLAVAGCSPAAQVERSAYSPAMQAPASP